MKRISMVVAAVLLAMIFAQVLGPTSSDSARAGLSWVPTSAPLPTPGQTPQKAKAHATLQRPASKDEAIRAALSFDKRVATWKQPWSEDTLQLEPGRVSVRWLPSRTDIQVLEGSAELGPVWEISIQGDVHTDLSHAPADFYYDGITYQVSQITGDILSWKTGPGKP